MTHIRLPLVVGFVVTLGCRTIPGQDVSYEPTPMPVVRAMLELAEVGPQDVVYDLGSGDGRIPITAAREFGARGVGIEIDPALVARSQANAREAGVEHKVEFRLGDMYTADIRSATVVVLFLHPGPNLKLRPKLLAELPPGSRVVSYIWGMGDWTAEEVRRIKGRRIFLWRIPARPAASSRRWRSPSRASCSASRPWMWRRSQESRCSWPQQHPRPAACPAGARCGSLPRARIAPVSGTCDYSARVVAA